MRRRIAVPPAFYLLARKTVVIDAVPVRGEEICKLRDEVAFLRLRHIPRQRRGVIHDARVLEQRAEDAADHAAGNACTCDRRGMQRKVLRVDRVLVLRVAQGTDIDADPVGEITVNVRVLRHEHRRREVLIELRFQRIQLVRLV